jgi:hypothetical protein
MENIAIKCYWIASTIEIKRRLYCHAETLTQKMVIFDGFSVFNKGVKLRFCEESVIPSQM